MAKPTKRKKKVDIDKIGDLEKRVKELEERERFRNIKPVLPSELPWNQPQKPWVTPKDYPYRPEIWCRL